MSNERINELNEAIKRNLAAFSAETQQNLDLRRKLLNDFTKNQVELYSNSIRNLGIISGVVAPLSLTLLGVESLNVNITFLVLGFVILIANIVLSQILLNSELESRRRKLGSAELEWVSASSSTYIVESEDKEIFERTNHISEYLNSVDRIDALLGLKLHDVDLLYANERLGRYNRYTNVVFAVGCGLIIFSTFCNLFFDTLS